MLFGALQILILTGLFPLIVFMLVAMVYLGSIFGHYLYLILKILAQGFKRSLMKGKHFLSLLDF
jgi:hypothetical protein